MDKSLYERYKDEILTDNTKIKYCNICKNCRNNSDGTDFSNQYTKAYCAIYQYPQHKPVNVINNTGGCAYRRVVKK